MSRTTTEAVAGIAEVDLNSVPDLTPFIETASAIVDDHCLNSGYDSTRLELIERWLAAHFYKIRDQATSLESARGVSVQYQHKVDLFLSNTMYGQQAMTLDSAGNLAAWQMSMQEGKRTTVGITYLGSDT